MPEEIRLMSFGSCLLCVCVFVCFTLELMTLFVNLVFRISASWFNSQIQEKANLEDNMDNGKKLTSSEQFYGMFRYEESLPVNI